MQVPAQQAPQAFPAARVSEQVLRLPQVKVVDLSTMGSDTVCTVLRCMNNGMLSGLQSLVIGSGGRGARQ